jgi:hypothetical protein
MAEGSFRMKTKQQPKLRICSYCNRLAEFWKDDESDYTLGVVTKKCIACEIQDKINRTNKI